MRKQSRNPVSVLAASILIVGFAVPSQSSEPGSSVFHDDVLPVLKALCYRCHAENDNDSGIRLDQLSPIAATAKDAEAWHDVLDQLNQGEMPPPKAKQPTAQERQLLTGWIQATLRDAAEANRFKAGRVTARRLTRYEYANTMRDLLGIDLDFARDLPPDPVSPSGFQNDAATLEMSPTQIEIYLDVARRALSEAIVTGERPPSYEYSETTTAIGNLPTRKFAGHLPVNPEFILDLKEFPRRGRFELNITARAAIPSDEDLPRMRVSMGHVPGIIHVPRGEIGEADVSADETTYTFHGRMEDLPQPGPVAFGNSGFKGMIVMIDFINADGQELHYPDRQYATRPPKPAKKKKAADPKKKAENPAESQPVAKPVSFGERLDIQVTRVEFKSPIDESWPPERHQRLLFKSEHSADEATYAREVLRRFMTRAYRRPVEGDEVEQTAELFDAIRVRSDSFEQAIRETFASVLVSPHVLYMVERSDRQSESKRVSDWELASRLSYFLWSSAPDQVLLDLAGEGKLRRSDVLEQQVARMLSDERSSEFVQRFIDQWLDLDALDRVAVNPEFFPDFDDELKQQMRRETQMYFAEILYNNRSALELLDSDWAMLNRPLAKHYGLKGQHGLQSPRTSRFERVALESTDRRGGLLWQAAFHLANSNGEDSHPIKRAVWILDRLLDAPPASPPADVPDLDTESPDLAKLTLKDQLAVHREKESCANCHQGIDPWGIPLENFDPVGHWRSSIPAHRQRPATLVDATSVLPDGTELDGVRQLQQHLLENHGEAFARSLVRRLMTYGLGRSLDYGDRETVDSLTRTFIKNEFKLKSLITDYVQSDPFQSK